MLVGHFLRVGRRTRLGERRGGVAGGEQHPRARGIALDADDSAPVGLLHGIERRSDRIERRDLGARPHGLAVAGASDGASEAAQRRRRWAAQSRRGPETPPPRPSLPAREESRAFIAVPLYAETSAREGGDLRRLRRGHRRVRGRVHPSLEVAVDGVVQGVQLFRGAAGQARGPGIVHPRRGTTASWRRRSRPRDPSRTKMCDGMCWACGAAGAILAYRRAAGRPSEASLGVSVA